MKTLKQFLEEAKTKTPQDKDVKDLPGTQPKGYYKGLSKGEKEERAKHFAKKSKMDDDDPRAYTPAPGDEDAKTKPSKHTKRFKKMFGEEVEALEEDVKKAIKDKAEKSGMPYSILKKVYDRGVAAWRTGHRPGTTPEQWGLARVNSFATKSSGTWGKADKDLADKVKGVKEEVELEEAISMKINRNTYFMGKDVGPVYTHHSGYSIAKVDGKWKMASPDDELVGEYRSLKSAKSELADLVNESVELQEAEYKGRKVKLNDPFRSNDGKHKFYVYVKNEKGNVIKLGFGDPNMEIKRDDPERRKSFRARHKCDTDPGPKWKARYWSCYQWRAGAKVDG